MPAYARLLPFLLCLCLHAEVPQPDWVQVESETMRHYQALLRIDTSDPPGNEAPAVDYLKSVLERDGIPVIIRASDAKRPNLIARLKGNGSRKPLLLMAHTDVVGVQPEKWKHPPFSAAHEGGYVYGRGTLDDKDNVVTVLMTLLLLKRHNIALDRDVIFLAEAGEEGSVRYGIKYMVENHWPDIEAEYCLAEGGAVYRRNGKLHRMNVGTTEKVPYAVRLIARGPSGHGSRPLQTNAVLHLSQAVAKAGTWRTPTRLNDTTRAYFERLATVSAPEDKARFNALLHPEKSDSIQDYLAANDPGHYSMLRTSISPTILNAGFRVNVIPSEAVATLDIRATPDEDLPAFLDALRKVIGDPAVEVTRTTRDTRPAAPPSRLDTDMFRIIESAQKRHYPGAITLPTMNTGATDMAYLRARGVQCYGIGPMVDEEDGAKGFGAHSDQERILESSLHQFVRFHWELVTEAAAKP